MITLKTAFTKKGWTFEQIARQGMIAIYHRTKGRVEDWEVVRIQSHNGREIAGEKFPPSEYYPSSETWGTHGWTYTSRELAERKMEKLLNAPAKEGK